MAKVFFISTNQTDPDTAIKDKLSKLIDKSGILDLIKANDETAVKIHFGDEGNTGHVKAEYAGVVCRKVAEKGASPFLTDTNTLYRGRRTNSADHVKPDTELVVYTSAVNGENAELQAAAELKIPFVRRGVLLTALMSHHNNIAVAGTHGKTTTTAMIAYVLTRSDSAPSFCVGAHVPILGSNAQIGGGKYFVAEADESDGTLIGFSPEYAVCLNIESEHLDFHRSMQALLATFETFLTSTLKTVFYCADCANCVALAKKLRSAISFGLAETADYRALDIQPTRRGSRFTVACRDQNIGTVELIIPGKQNVVNALAAIAVADQLGVSFERVAEALGGLPKIKMHCSVLAEQALKSAIDDYIAKKKKA